MPGGRRFCTGKEFCKRALAHTVCPDYPQHLATPDRTAADGQVEGVILLGHGRDLKEVLAVGSLVMRPLFKNDLGIAEADILFMQVAFEVLVDADPDPLGAGDDTEYRRFAVPDMHGIGKHVEDCKVVLHDDDRPFLRKLADQFCRGNPLVDIQKRGDLVEEIQVGIPGKAGCNGHPLQLAAAERADLMIEDGR